MINKKSLTKVVKRILRSKSGIQNPTIMHPLREWGIGLLIAVIIFSVIAVWSAHTYLSNRDVGATEVSFNENEVVVYRASMVQAALKILGLRKETHNKLLLDTTIVPELEDVVGTTSSSTAEEIEEVTTSSTFSEETVASNNPTSETEGASDPEDQVGAETEPAVEETESQSQPPTSTTTYDATFE